MLSLCLALACSVSYGCADFAGGLAARDAHVLRVVAVTAPASLVVALLLLPITGARWGGEALIWGAASGVGSVAAFCLLYLTLALGPMSVLSPITALVSGALPVFAGVALGEHLHLLAVVGVSLAAAAVVLISAAPDTQRRRPPLGPLLLAVAAGAAIAGQLICLNQAPSDSGVAPLVMGRVVCSGIIIGAAVLRRGQLGSHRPDVALSVTAGVLDAMANFAFLIATRHGELAIVGVIAALYPAATLALARGVLHERVSGPQAGGLLVAAGAVVLLALA